MSKGVYVSDSLHGMIRLSEYEKKLISSMGFNRLHDIYQNSTVYLTFPANRTKRFEHSIGTMKICSDMFYYAVSNASDSDLKSFYDMYYAETKRVISQMNADDYGVILKRMPRKIPDIELENLRKSLIPSNVPSDYERLHVLLIEAVRAAALLHDIGHPPFSHVIERAIKAVYLSEGKKNASWDRFRNKMEKYFRGGSQLHEVMGEEISKNILKSIIVSSEKSHTEKEKQFEAIILEIVLRIFRETGRFAELHRLIDGSLDGDRLDYVTRDPVNSGMRSGSVDYNRILLDMKIRIKDDTPLFCVPVKAVNAVEDFLKRRYDLYKNIIYHHRVIKTDYLLENTVYHLVHHHLDENRKQKKEDEQKNEASMAIPYDISGLWFPLGSSTLNEKNCALSQWNDSWLVTVLKQIYYQDYYEIDDMRNNSSEYIVSRQLNELLSNEKQYYSFVKRHEDFKVVDDAFLDAIHDRKKDISMAVINLRTLSQSHSSVKVGKNEVNIDESLTLQFIERLIAERKTVSEGFMMAQIMLNLSAVGLHREEITEEVKTASVKACREVFSDEHYRHLMTVFKEISIGLSEQIYFYDISDDIHPLDEISGIKKSLMTENLYRPVFYLYVLIDGDVSNIEEKKKMTLEKTGQMLGDYVAERILTFLDEQKALMSNN